MLKTIDPITDRRWDDFVTRHPAGTIFHHSAWARVLQDRYSNGFSYYVLENENGEITAAAPFVHLRSPLTGNRLVCLPSSEYCYPLADSQANMDQLLQEALQKVNDESGAYLEIRGWGSEARPEEIGLKGHDYYLTHVIELDGDMDAVRKRMTRNGRYNLRYSEKTPVNVRMGQDESDLKELYRLCVATRRRLSLLPQPYGFFKSMYRHIITGGHGFILLAELDGKVISASMYFRYKDTVLHEISAQDKDYFEYRPNYLIISKAIQQHCDQSARYYHFGCTHPENESLANFKRQWGSREAVYPFYYYPEVKGIKSFRKDGLIYRTYNTINRCLPGCVLDVASKLASRHMG